jgi:hypothetical protein
MLSSDRTDKLWVFLQADERERLIIGILSIAIFNNRV